MKDEDEIRGMLKRHEGRMSGRDGEALSHEIGFRNALRWVLDNSGGGPND